jgi:hypothetical protein
MAITECRFDAAAPFHLTVVFRLPLLVKNLGKKIDFKRQSLPSALRKTLSGRGREFSPVEVVFLGAPDTHDQNKKQGLAEWGIGSVCAAEILRRQCLLWVISSL